MMAKLVKKLLFCGAKSFPSDIPEGHIWLCVGMDEQQQRRFELEVHYLNHPLFEDLLRHSVDQFGYSYCGAVRIACEAELFLHIMHLLQSSDPSVHYMELQDIRDRFVSTSGQTHRRHRGCDG